MPATTRRATVPSPCTSVCKLDPSTGWCEGCFRTIEEIAAWGMLDDDGKRAILAALARRRRTAKDSRGER